MTSRLLAGVLLALLTGPSWLIAQTADVRGRVIDADGQPLADQTVLLHRIIGDSGANIAQARSDSAGNFVIPADTTGATAAVYFLAARWQDELYIGEAFQAPVDAGEHLLQVGVPGTSATALLGGAAPLAGSSEPAPPVTAGSPATYTSWLLLLIPTVAVLGVATWLLFRNRPAIPERRRLLARIAELDIEHASAGGEAYQAQRAELIARLRETTGT